MRIIKRCRLCLGLCIILLFFCGFDNKIGSNDNLKLEDLKSDSMIQEIIEMPDEMLNKYSNVLSIEKKIIAKDEIANYVTAKKCDKDGLVSDMDAEAMITKISFLNDNNQNTITNFYLLTASTSEQKTSEETITSKGVTLNGCIGWIDNIGPINEFVYASGSRSGSYSGNGFYEALRGTSVLCSGNFSTNFYSTSDLSDSTGISFRLFVRSATSQDGSNVILNFTTSIFD